MPGSPVEVRVGGQTYRVVASAGTDELERLARIVDAKLRELSPGPGVHPQGMLLVAMTLAHELDAERERARAAERRSTDLLASLLERVDDALGLLDDDGEGPGDGLGDGAAASP
ncbi:MAG: cell division protein ZapA [Deltaproteobacteria bacterium]|nr:cell division protein ZapA [Deltaproteobacteria bacterium]